METKPYKISTFPLTVTLANTFLATPLFLNNELLNQLLNIAEEVISKRLKVYRLIFFMAFGHLY